MNVVYFYNATLHRVDTYNNSIRFHLLPKLFTFDKVEEKGYIIPVCFPATPDMVKEVKLGIKVKITIEFDDAS